RAVVTLGAHALTGVITVLAVRLVLVALDVLARARVGIVLLVATAVRAHARAVIVGVFVLAVGVALVVLVTDAGALLVVPVGVLPAVFVLVARWLAGRGARWASIARRATVTRGARGARVVVVVRPRRSRTLLVVIRLLALLLLLLALVLALGIDHVSGN